MTTEGGQVLPFTRKCRDCGFGMRGVQLERWELVDLCPLCAGRRAQESINSHVTDHLSRTARELTGQTLPELLTDYDARSYVPTFRFDWDDGRDGDRRLVADLYDQLMLARGRRVKCHRIEPLAAAAGDDT